MADAKRVFPDSPNTHTSERLIMGALAGLVATIPMTWALGTIDTTADDELIANIVHRTGYPLDADGRHLATFVSRFGFGASGGFLFAVLQKRLGPNGLGNLRPEYRAPVFALGLWALTAIGKRAVSRSRPVHARDEVILFGAHLLWGFSLARLVEASPRDVLFGIANGVFGRSLLARKVRAFVS